MKQIKKTKPEIVSHLIGKFTCPHCGKSINNVDLNIISILCLSCGNPVKLMWENKIK